MNYATLTERRSGESRDDYRARMLKMAAGHPGVVVRGHVASAQGFVPWQRAQSTFIVEEDWNRLPEAEKKAILARNRDLAQQEHDEAAEAFRRETAPFVRKLTGTERLEALTKLLITEAQRSWEQEGRIRLPRSVIDAICREEAMEGRFLDAKKIEEMTLEQVRPLIQRRAQLLLQKAARKNGNDRTPEIGGK